MHGKKAPEDPGLRRHRVHDPLANNGALIQQLHRPRHQVRAQSETRMGSFVEIEIAKSHGMRKNFRLPKRETYAFSRDGVNRSRSISDQSNVAASNRAKPHARRDRPSFPAGGQGRTESVPHRREEAAERFFDSELRGA